MSDILTIKQIPLQDKKVLIRVDFNVPLNQKGEITDDTRIKASLPTIKYVLEQGGAVILMSHLGRPKGKHSPEFSLTPCARRLSQLLGKPVLMATDCIGQEVTQQIQNLKPGQIILLENLRFHPGEEHPDQDPSFAKQLADFGDIYINDAFGTAHRAHASTATITNYFLGKAAAGFLLENEIYFLNQMLRDPKRPFCAIVGGAKISSKIGILESLLDKVDLLLIGGGMAFTFFKAQGIPIGDSIHEDEFLEKAKQLLTKGQNKIVLPVDIITADALADQAQIKTVDIQTGIQSPFQGVDIGPKTVQLFTDKLKDAATILWNGPLGIFEIDPFAKGTRAIAQVVANSSAITIVGGGDSIAALQKEGLANQITHLSTGGGATLEYLEHGTLPGIEALAEAADAYKNG